MKKQPEQTVAIYSAAYRNITTLHLDNRMHQQATNDWNIVLCRFMNGGEQR